MISLYLVIFLLARMLYPKDTHHTVLLLCVSVSARGYSRQKRQRAVDTQCGDRMGTAEQIPNTLQRECRMIFHQQRLHEPLFFRIVLQKRWSTSRDRTAFLGEKMAHQARLLWNCQRNQEEDFCGLALWISIHLIDSPSVFGWLITLSLYLIGTNKIDSLRLICGPKQNVCTSVYG